VIYANVLIILLLDIWPEYVRSRGVMTAPTGTRRRGLGSEILLGTLAGRVLKSEHGSVISFVFFGLFEHGLVGLDVAFVVPTSRHGVQDVQKWSRGGC